LRTPKRVIHDKQLFMRPYEGCDHSGFKYNQLHGSVYCGLHKMNTRFHEGIRMEAYTFLTWSPSKCVLQSVSVCTPSRMACARQLKSSGNNHHEAFVAVAVKRNPSAAEHKEHMWLQQLEEVCPQLNIENLKNFMAHYQLITKLTIIFYMYQ
ncbi:hypothetical protein KIN20_022574, partial [Parelaphostrongylus tenuis]